MYGQPVYYAPPIAYAPMYAASAPPAPPAPGGGSPPTGYSQQPYASGSPPPGYSPRSVAEWQRYYAKPQQPYPYYGAYASPPYSQTSSPPPSPPQHAPSYATAPPLSPEEPPPPPARKRNRYTTTYKQGQSAFRFKGTAANIPATPADDVQHFPDARGRPSERSPPSKRDVSPVVSPRGTTRFRIKPGAYDSLFPSSPEAADDNVSVEKGDNAVPPALLERFEAMDAAETRKRAESADVQSAASSPRTIASPGTTPPASPPSQPRPVWSGACDDNASWAEEPAPAEPGLVHRGEIFFSPGKPEVVPTPRGSRGSKFDLPSPSTALGALQNDLF